MQNELILQYLNEERIEDLKKKIAEEIYEKELKKSIGASAAKRYAAMKRYFKYSDKNKDARLIYPCTNVRVNTWGKEAVYNCFCDSYTFVMTNENIGELTDYRSVKDNDYFDFSRIFSNAEKESGIVDLSSVLAKAKAKGYRLKKKEYTDFAYAWKYKDAYFKVGLLDLAFAIINDGNKVKVHYTDPGSIMIIETSIGFAGILPFYRSDASNKIIIIE